MDKKTTEDIIVPGMNKQVFAVIVKDEFENIFFGIRRNENWEIIPCGEPDFKESFVASGRPARLNRQGCLFYE